MSGGSDVFRAIRRVKAEATRFDELGVESKKVVWPSNYSIDAKPRYQGLVLLIQANNNQIVELDKDNKPRVTSTGLAPTGSLASLRGFRMA